MAYDENLEDRMDEIGLSETLTKKKMFGGIAYLLNGNMCVGIHKDYLVLRLNVEKASDLMENHQFLPFDITGSPMKGWVMIEGSMVEEDIDLEGYMQEAVSFVETLPKKVKKNKKLTSK